MHYMCIICIYARPRGYRLNSYVSKATHTFHQWVEHASLFCLVLLCVVCVCVCFYQPGCFVRFRFVLFFVCSCSPFFLFAFFIIVFHCGVCVFIPHHQLTHGTSEHIYAQCSFIGITLIHYSTRHTTT